MRSIVALGAAALALAVGAQAVLGAVPISETGTRGQWSLIDTDASPGSTCTYDVPGGAGNDLDIVEAKSPRVLARDRTSRRDGQWVGIRVIFQRSVNDGGTGGWVKASATPWVKKFAYEDKAVSIGKRSWQAAYTGTPHFRVLATIRWYKPGSDTLVQGSTKVRYQKYLAANLGSSSVEDDRCLPEF